MEIIKSLVTNPDPHYFWKLDPDPYYFMEADPDPHWSEKLHPDPHYSQNSEDLEAQNRAGCSQWRPGGSQWSPAVAADFHYSDEEQDPDRIDVKSWIRIRNTN